MFSKKEKALKGIWISKLVLCEVVTHSTFASWLVLNTLDIRYPVVSVSGNGQVYPVEAHEEEEYYEDEGWGLMLPICWFWFMMFLAYIMIVADVPSFQTNVLFVNLMDDCNI